MRPRIVVWLLSAILLASLMSLAQKPAGVQRRSSLPKTTSFTRPKPTRPIRPEIPSQNRYQDDKVFLEKADSLFSFPTANNQERQIVKGNVTFRQGGLYMFCDSAYYYPDYNSMDAFGHVRMEQGDTLFAYADQLYYSGDRRLARLRCGPTQERVKLVNRDVVLLTDSLDYDLVQDLGSYEYGGEIDDKVNRLTSWQGFYSPATKDAQFYYDVKLVNEKDGFTLLSDTLFYNTETKLARIVSPSEIQSETDTIVTSSGIYNTLSGNADLMARSLIIHRDSTGNVTTLEGDSIVYDKATRISRVYSFNEYWQNPRPMVLTDTARKVTLIGGYGEYNDSTRESFATIYPLLIEYSKPDSLFLRADTIRSLMARHLTLPDSVIAKAPRDSLGNALTDSTMMVWQEFHEAYAWPRARFFRADLQGVADTLRYIEYDSMMYMIRKPIVWAEGRQAYGNVINVHFNDSTADYAELPDYGILGELVDEDFYNQLSGKKMLLTFEDQKLKRLDADGNIQVIMMPQEQDSTYNKLVNAESSFLTVDMAKAGETMEKLKMWPDVSGTVTPLFLLKPSQKYLEGFQWYEAIRPKREWYDDENGDTHVRWDDELGELPEELEAYFNEEGKQMGRRRLAPKPAAAETAPETPTDAAPAEGEGSDELNPEAGNTESAAAEGTTEGTTEGAETGGTTQTEEQP